MSSPARDHRDDGTPGLAIVLSLWATIALGVAAWAIIDHSPVLAVLAAFLLLSLIWTAATES